MNNKGFTLIELLGVVVILGIISLIAFPPIINQVKNSRDDTDENNKSIIFDAAEEYILEHEDVEHDLNMNANKVYYVSLQTLVDDGKLTEPITDIKTGESYNLNRCVMVKYNNMSDTSDTLLDTNCPS
jgi:prepilin-type N-terminal cleavage/methylation domain-containing protein